MMEFRDYGFNEDIILGPYTYQIASHNNSYWLMEIGHHSSDIIFEYLEIKEIKRKYTHDIVGYDVDVTHTFPKVDTLEDLNKVIKQLQIDCLIKEAKEKYPVGTRYRPVLIDNVGKGIFIVGDDQKVVFNDNGGVYLENPDGYLWNKERNNHTGNQNLYYNGRWAEIIIEEPKQPEINTYGLKVGDFLRKDIISFWGAHSKNFYASSFTEWKKCNGNFSENRKIESFEVFNGVVGFLVSDTTNVYLRAEGFKEFAEGFKKSESVFEFEAGKWYKCKGYDYAIKYLRKEVRNSKYAIVYSDIIITRYESFPEGNTGVGYVDEKTWYELTDLSEIQQYLPEGHPDKINQNNLIPGRWYKVQDVSEYIAKFIEIKNGNFIHPGYFIRDRKYFVWTKDDQLIKIENKQFTEVPIEEIQQYLPFNHSDKIKAQPEYIVGKWYRLGAWIAKFEKLKGDRFLCSMSGTPFDNYRYSEFGNLSIDRHGTPVLITDMTEVYNLFPEEKPIDSDLELKRWYEDGDFIVYLYARNSVYGFHHDKWFESAGFSEKDLKLCHPQKVDDKLSKYIRNKYQIGDTVTCPYDQQIFKIKELDLNIRKDRIIVSASSIKKRYGFLFYQGKWAEMKSDWKISERELNYPLTSYEVFSVEPPINLPNKEKYYAGTDIIMPDYDKYIEENNSKQESTTELLLKTKNKKQKFVKLTEIQTIKL